MNRWKFLGLICVLLVAAPSRAAAPPADADKTLAEVRTELAHAWHGYREHAWGHDALKPLSKQPHDWYAHTLLMTPVDALDTLLIAGMKDEADAARELIDTKLDFDQDVYVKNFEVTIRLLGGLLSGYQMTGDAKLLALAKDLGTRLLPAFDSPTGLPYVEVNLRTGKTRGKETNPAETGTLLLEFGTLSKLTGDPQFYDKAKRALVATFARRSALDLVGSTIDVETGKWTDPTSHISGGIDSYYEYLFKCWRLFGDEDCLAMWRTSIAAVNRHLADESRGALWYGQADMNTGKRTGTQYGALDAFFPAVLALSGDLERAKRLQASSFAMWKLAGIEPETIDWRTMKIESPGYALRPEIVESTYYLYRLTGDPAYRRMGRRLFEDFRKYCRTEAGYAALKDVVKKEQRDSMESFVLAETFKYFYLLFAPRDALDLDAVVLNTEAHPLRKTWTDAPPRAALDPTALVDPLIGTRNGGNTFPGAVVPFGMVQFSPENTKGTHVKTAAPGGYQYDATRIRGFALTHLSGTGCRGASGDIPFMPIAEDVSSSPSSDRDDSRYASGFNHADESALPGYYRVRLDNGVEVELGATARTGAMRLSYPPDRPATLLVRTSDSEVGSSDATVEVDASARRISGSVTSGNFCGYLDKEDRRSYYTLHFVAEFDADFAAVGSWHDDRVDATATAARGGTGWDDAGLPVEGRGSGAFVRFARPDVTMRVGVSYVSVANAAANLAAENPTDTSFDNVAQRAHDRWRDALAKIAVDGDDHARLATFYTALYHALLHPNLFSDANGEYAGFDGAVHRVTSPQSAQYANFSGWDVYRSQLQLVTLLFPDIGADIAQSLFNQAAQNGGEWDRWTHDTGGTHVMSGDPSAPAIAGIHAFGGTRFDAKGAFESLYAAATKPTAHDLSRAGCPVMCVGQRPSLDQWLKLGYVATDSNAWGGAAETLEDAAADFALGELAARLGDAKRADALRARSRNWRHLFNPRATAQGGFIQDRNADGSWPRFDPAADYGFVEGSAAQYLWMVPFDVRGLFERLGGNDAACRRLDAFFHRDDGSLALTKAGALHAELDNEPSIAAPWLYVYCGRPDATQAIVRAALDTLWSPKPEGIPGNDDLGAMSSWYVWAALGLYPLIPGRAELIVSTPVFAHARIERGDASIAIDAKIDGGDARFVQALRLDSAPRDAAWLPESLVVRGGRIELELGAKPAATWARDATSPPPPE